MRTKRLMLVRGGGILFAAALGLSSCARFDGPSIDYYTYDNLQPKIHVTPTGVSGAGTALVVQRDGIDNLGFTTDTDQSFSRYLYQGVSYSLSITSQPTNPARTCTLLNHTGTGTGQSVYERVTCISGQYSGGTTIGTIVFGGTPQIVTPYGSYPAVAANTTDGVGNAARFNSPRSLTTDGTYLYVADTGNHRVRRINPTDGTVTTIAGSGSGSADGVGTGAQFNGPRGITSDNVYLYVADTGNHTIRRITIADGTVLTIAGTAGSSGSTNGTGTAARFNGPRGVTTDGNYLYVADTNNDLIRKIDLATMAVTTLAGSGVGGTTDAVGTAAQFNGPESLTIYNGFLYVVENVNTSLRMVTVASQVVQTLAAIGTTGRGITTDGTYLYISANDDTIRKYDSMGTGGALTSIAGAGVCYLDGNTPGT
ncbi:MAG: hypothetical protein HY042_13050, partial [Spirochaetia bacterium]|nr:hypothetical protein [Spirochaetia bacterium]